MERREGRFAIIRNWRENKYHGRTDGDSDSEIHLVLVRDSDSSDVLRSENDERGKTSAALPTIGRTINPMNVVDTPEEATMASIELMRNSAQTATTAVDASSNRTETRGVISATSCSSDSVSVVGSS